MRAPIALLLFLVVMPALATRPARTVARAIPPHADCPKSAPQPSGVCLPYDREHCRFLDGTLLRDDPRDERAPYLLKPVGNGVYCRYDVAAQPAGVVVVLTPAEQKAKWDATKARRHHG